MENQWGGFGHFFNRAAVAAVGLILFAAFSVNTYAIDIGDWQVSGFGTLGVVYNDSDDVDFVRDLSQPSGPRGGLGTTPDTVLGMQAGYQATGDLRLVMQAVSRYDYTSNYDPRVTWAFVDYSPDPGFSLRLGRVGFDAFMRSDSRSVGYSFLSVREPLEYFGTLELTHIDGADAVYKIPLGKGLLSAKLYAGFTDEETSEYDLEGTRIVGGYLNFEKGAWQVRAGVSDAKLDKRAPSLQPLFTALRSAGDEEAALANDMALADSRVRNWNLGFIYESGPFQAQLLYNRRQAETLLLADADNIYALLAYRWSRVTPYFGFATAEADSTRRDVANFPAEVLDPVFAGARFGQRTFIAGVRYDVARNMDVKAQVDYVEAPVPLGSPFPDKDPQWNGYTTAFSIVLDFIF